MIYKHIVENLGEGIWVCDLQGNTIYVNDIMASLIGYTTQEIIGKPLHFFTDCEGAAKVQKISDLRAEQRDRKKQTFELKFITKNGDRFWTLVSATLMLDSGGEHLGSAARVILITERKHTEELFRSAFYLTPTPMLISTVADGRYVDVNDAFLSLLGYTRSDLIGKTSVELNVWLSEQERLSSLSLLKVKGFLSNHESAFRIKSGEIRYFRINVHLVEVNKENYLIFSTMDLAELKRSEEWFHKAFYNNASPMVLSTIKEGRILDANASFLELIGYSKEEVIGQTAAELKMWSSNSDRTVAYDQLQQNRHLKNYECIAKTRNGDLRWVLLSTEIIEIEGVTYCLSSLTDITERKIAEDAIKERKENFKAAENIARLGHFEWDIIRQKLRWSDQMYRNLGYFPGEITPSEAVFQGKIHPEDAPWVKEYFTYARAKSFLDLQYRIVRADGLVAWMYIRAKMLHDDKGNLIKMFGTCQDITEQKQNQDGVTRAERELALTNQLYSRSTFLNNLISNEYSTDFLYQQLNQYGIDPQKEYCCYVIHHDWLPENLSREFHGHPIDNWLLVCWLFEKTIGWVWKYDEHIIFLAPVRENDLSTRTRQAEYAAHLAKEIERRFPGLQLRIGISGISDHPLDIKDLYEKAHRSLRVAVSVGNRITHYTDIGVYEIAFQLMKDKSTNRLFQNTIARIAEHDEINDGCLLVTIERILEEDTLKSAAQKLHVHYNTIIWRKQKIEKILAMSLDSVESRCLLMLHMKMWKLYNAQV